MNLRTHCENDICSNALLLTDTAFYRNKNYHESSDTMETLDINKMAKVNNGVYQALAAM